MLESDCCLAKVSFPLKPRLLFSILPKIWSIVFSWTTSLPYEVAFEIEASPPFSEALLFNVFPIIAALPAFYSEL